MPRIVVFHTSDMHNRLTRAKADRLRELKSADPESLMLDSGDAIWSGNIYWRPGGEPILDLMNSVPYDALCVGNREFHFWGVGLSAKISRADFPVLSANIRPNNGQRIPTQPYVQFKRDGLRITVIGLCVPCVTERMLVKKISDYYFEDPIKAAAELVPKLRPECDLLIALTHIGIAKDKELAQRVPGIDMIFGGHTHTFSPPFTRLDETIILHHGYYAQQVARTQIDVEDGKIVGVTDDLIALAGS